MSMQYIRDTYGVPAKRGARVEYEAAGGPRLGTVTSSKGPHLLIRLDGDIHSLPFHPTWRLRYLDGATANDGEAKHG